MMLETIEDWLYGGVDIDFPGNGGPECSSYSSTERKLLEGFIVSSLIITMMIYTYKKLSPLPKHDSEMYHLKYEPLKQILLVTMCIVFGMEIGFKFASRSVIFLLNPCHVVTAIQIYLLAAKPSKTVAAIFRAHLNVINGPILACLFPEVDTLVLPLETPVFWMQHLLMIIIPVCMIYMGGVYSVEAPSHMSWFVFSYGIVLLYHFALLLSISMVTEMNLNHMLCPAESDPFIGPNYKLIAIIHQAIFTPFVSRLFCVWNIIVRKVKGDYKYCDKIDDGFLESNNKKQH